jgi:YHS domain-containing protein
MNMIKNLTATLMAVSVLGAPLFVSAADQKTETKLKPYTLKTCVVSGDKLGEMGDAYVYKYQDREIKFCCKGCLKDFNKEPAKYIKKIEEAEKAQKNEKPAQPGAAAGEHAEHQH